MLKTCHWTYSHAALELYEVISVMGHENGYPANWHAIWTRSENDSFDKTNHSLLTQDSIGT